MFENLFATSKNRSFAGRSLPLLSTTAIPRQFSLTPREQETTELLMLGLSSKEIASRMSISPNSVKAFLRLVMFKMGVTSRSGVVGKILAHTVGRTPKV